MTKNQFIRLLNNNREFSNALESMTDAEKASIKGGATFRKVHQTDLKIAEQVGKNKVFSTIVENGTY